MLGQDFFSIVTNKPNLSDFNPKKRDCNIDSLNLILQKKYIKQNVVAQFLLFVFLMQQNFQYHSHRIYFHLIQ